VRPLLEDPMSAEYAASAEVDPFRPYARKTFADVADDYVLVRGDLTEQYAREQLVREHEARVQAARDEERARIVEEWRSKPGRNLNTIPVDWLLDTRGGAR
jgi:hypothetical protein